MLKRLVVGLKNSQKIRVIVNGVAFHTLAEAIAHARALGFECSIVSSDPSVEPISVKPY